MQAVHLQGPAANQLFVLSTDQTAGFFSLEDLVPNQELRVLVDKFVKDNDNNNKKQWNNVNSKVVEGHR